MSELADSAFNSGTSEPELDSDHGENDPNDPDDPQTLLGTWLGELEHLTMGLDAMSSDSNPSLTPTSEKCYPRMDSYRFSMANLEDSQDVELDAILGELCALENQFDQEINMQNPVRTLTSLPQTVISTEMQKQGIYFNSAGSQHFVSHSRSSSSGGNKFDIPGLQYEAEQNMRNQLRTDSPDADSAFSDTVSMLSSESSASSGGSGRQNENLLSTSKKVAPISSPTQLLDNIIDRLHVIRNDLLDKENTPPAEQAARLKAEKIKIALEKIKEASVKKLFIKVFTVDNSTKSLLVDEKMSAGYVCKLLADKNHVKMDPKWVLVEHFPELHMERIYEDNENLVTNLMMWARDSKNKLLYQERAEKYDLFIQPENYLLLGASSEKGANLDDDARSTLLEEFFASSYGGSIPELEGNLYLKSDGKKAWKKHYCVLRASGLYYSPKGKSKSSKDLICLVTFEMNNVYFGIGWKKKYKAPTDHCFALKHPQIQTKSSKYIKYLCAEDERTLKQWVMGIRIAKYGRHLVDNYEMLVRDLAEEDLDKLAYARSFSVSSMAKTLQLSPDTSNDSSTSTPSSESKDVTIIERSPERSWRISRQDSIRSNSSSSCCMSDQGSTESSFTAPSANSSDTSSCGFDADYPATGTIKRKPSMAPKIPLTITTRNIAKQSVAEESHPGEYDACSISSGSSSGSGGLQIYASLNRKMSIGERYAMMRRSSGSMSSHHRAAYEPSNSLDEVDDLPLPPPPEIGSTLELNEELEVALPPPPPEAYFDETSTDNTLPLPPPPQTFRDSGVYNDQMSDVTSPCSTTSNYGLPSPPPQPKICYSRPTSQYSSAVKFSSNRRASEADAGGHYTPHPFLAELKNNQTSPNSARRISQSTRKTSIDPVLPAPPPPPPPPPPGPVNNNATLRPCKKQQNLIKSETSKSFSCQTLPNRQRRSSNAQAVPPTDFIQDLQRVMHKKWNMAQRLQVDVVEPPTKQIMGFRDHTFCPAERPFGPPPASDIVKITPKKKPPPPPPKRSDTTQLTKAN